MVPRITDAEWTFLRLIEDSEAVRIGPSTMSYAPRFYAAKNGQPLTADLNTVFSLIEKSLVLMKSQGGAVYCFLTEFGEEEVKRCADTKE